MPKHTNQPLYGEPTTSYDGLSRLLQRSVLTIRSDRCRKPESLPPASVIPGSSRPIWIVADVLEWLRQHRQAGAVTQNSKAHSTK